MVETEIDQVVLNLLDIGMTRRVTDRRGMKERLGDVVVRKFTTWFMAFLSSCANSLRGSWRFCISGYAYMHMQRSVEALCGFHAGGVQG